MLAQKFEKLHSINMLPIGVMFHFVLFAFSGFFYEIPSNSIPIVGLYILRAGIGILHAFKFVELHERVLKFIYYQFHTIDTSRFRLVMKSL